MTTTIEDKIRGMAEPFVAGFGAELVAVSYAAEHGRKVLRLFVDKEGGITLDDLSAISREFGALLDAENAVSERYTLEVSSPGLDRPLFKETDYARFAGKKANIRTKDAIDGRRNFKATILGIENGVVRLRDADGRSYDVKFSNIEKARLVVEL